jgi:hypothetical protein
MDTIDDITRLKMKILTKHVESHNPQLGVLDDLPFIP